MVADATAVRQPGASREAENLRFRRYLRAHHISEDPLRIIARRHLSEFDCTGCGNCCRETRVVVSPADIDRIADHLRMRPDDVVRKYTVHDSDNEETLLLQQNDACVFLDRNVCIIYQARPNSCRNFPPIAARARLLGGRMSSVCRQAGICPVVEESLEEYKKLVGFHAGIQPG